MADPHERRILHSPTIVAQQAREIALEAYIYGYPLVLFDATRESLTNLAAPGETGAPMNQFCHRRTFPDPSLTAVVGPNADTLYSFAFLDVSTDPMVLSVPDVGTRYYLMQMLDAWTNVFASPGTRTTGNGKGAFAITGPKGGGELPAGVQEVKSPTDLVWIIGRTQTNGKSDYAAVHEIQDKYKLTPLSSYGRPYTAPVNLRLNPNLDLKATAVDRVARMGAEAFFSRLNSLMRNNPPTAADAEFVKRFAMIGVAPGRTFNLQNMDPVMAREIEAGTRDAQARIVAEARKPHGRNLNGWEFSTNTGRYGTNYLWRAVVSFFGLGANLPEDAIYPHASKDADGQPLNGNNRYQITFARGQLPPVGAFWSITLYNDRHFFVPNPIERYAIGDRDRIEFNRDGSLTLHVQHVSPGKDKESNWLPAPKEGFNLVMRLYWPKKEVIDGRWKPPRIERKQTEVKRIA